MRELIGPAITLPGSSEVGLDMVLEPEIECHAHQIPALAPPSFTPNDCQGGLFPSCAARRRVGSAQSSLSPRIN